MNNLSQQSLASIATKQFQSVQIFEKYNLDFCCKGKKTLAAACEDKGLPLEQIMQELDIVLNADERSTDFENMSAEELISYIILHHHFYVKQALTTIITHLEKVVNKHGENYPFMVKVFEMFKQVEAELLPHMQKEELVLFPKIREIETFIKYNSTNLVSLDYLSMPINLMEIEHENAGGLMGKIRELTNNYIIQDSMCTTFKITIAELQDFEENLHQHIHLENNILFPMAENMVKHLYNKSKTL